MPVRLALFLLLLSSSSSSSVLLRDDGGTTVVLTRSSPTRGEEPKPSIRFVALRTPPVLEAGERVLSGGSVRVGEVVVVASREIPVSEATGVACFSTSVILDGVRGTGSRQIRQIDGGFWDRREG